MKRLYTVILTLLLPFIFLRLLWRSIKQPAYRKRWKERTGVVPFQKLSSSIWLHAVSVGEVNAAIPLIQGLIKKYPNLSLVVTTTTPTGSAQLLKQIKNIHHVYVPLDVPWFIHRFLTHINPKLCILMETELWPNLISCCHLKKIPVLIANARLSAKSFKRYFKIKSLLKSLWPYIDVIGTQTTMDLTHFQKLGMPHNRLKVLGNLKFDMPLPKNINRLATDLQKIIGADRPIWVAASTHEGEEKIILDALKNILANYKKNLLLVLIPRHLPRFDSVANLIQQEGLHFIRRSDMSKRTVSAQD